MKKILAWKIVLLYGVNTAQNFDFTPSTKIQRKFIFKKVKKQKE